MPFYRDRPLLRPYLDTICAAVKAEARTRRRGRPKPDGGATADLTGPAGAGVPGAAMSASGDTARPGNGLVMRRSRRGRRELEGCEGVIPASVAAAGEAPHLLDPVEEAFGAVPLAVEPRAEGEVTFRIVRGGTLANTPRAAVSPRMAALSWALSASRTPPGANRVGCPRSTGASPACPSVGSGWIGRPSASTRARILVPPRSVPCADRRCHPGPFLMAAACGGRKHRMRRSSRSRRQGGGDRFQQPVQDPGRSPASARNDFGESARTLALRHVRPRRPVRNRQRMPLITSRPSIRAACSVIMGR